MPPTSAPVSATAHSAKRCSARTSRVNYAQTPVSSSRANSYQTARMLPPSRPFSTSSSNLKQFHYDDVANCLYASPLCFFCQKFFCARSFVWQKFQYAGQSQCQRCSPPLSSQFISQKLYIVPNIKVPFTLRYFMPKCHKNSPFLNRVFM